jgi:NADPH:quinone reductase-like Zn-dependent oxidoreductase
MKAIRVTAYGGPESLELQDIEEPRIGDDDVLIDVASTSVNPIDWKIATGAMKAFMPLTLPFTPGVDAAGTVIALGRKVSGLAVGDEVFGFIGITGGYATRAVANADRLARKPKNLSFLHQERVCVSPPTRSSTRSTSDTVRSATRSDGVRLSHLASLYESGQLTTEIDSVYPLARAGEAMAKSMTGHVRGKIVIELSDKS